MARVLSQRRQTSNWLLMMSWLLFSLTGATGPVGAADCKWADGTGSVAADVLTPGEAKQLALRQARAMAIAKVTGTEVRSQTVVKDFMLASDFIKTLVNGYVRAEQIVRWEQDKYQPSPNEPPIPILRVHLRACVLPRASMHDPEFVVRAELNKYVFVPGEKGTLRVTSSRRAHVAIFNLTADDRIRPYIGQPGIGPPLLLEAGEAASFPPAGVSLVMELPPGQPRTSEAFIVVATKAEDQVVLPVRIGVQESLSIAEFYAGFGSIDADVVETIVPYSILGR